MIFNHCPTMAELLNAWDDGHRGLVYWESDGINICVSITALLYGEIA